MGNFNLYFESHGVETVLFTDVCSVCLRYQIHSSLSHEKLDMAKRNLRKRLYVNALIQLCHR